MKRKGRSWEGERSVTEGDSTLPLRKSLKMRCVQKFYADQHSADQFNENSKHYPGHDDTLPEHDQTYTARLKLAKIMFARFYQNHAITNKPDEIDFSGDSADSIIESSDNEI